MQSESTEIKKIDFERVKALSAKYLAGPVIFAAIEPDVEKIIRFTVAFCVSALVFGKSTKKED